MHRVNYRRNQSSLHQSIEQAYGSVTGRETEVSVEIDGKLYRLDVYDRLENTAYEIQLSGFGKKFYSKISSLLSNMNVVIIHPISIKQKIIRMKGDEIISTRYSTDKAGYYTFFEHVAGFRTPFIQEKMRFDLLLIREKVWKQCVRTVKGRSRYKTVGRDLLDIKDKKIIENKDNFKQMFPEGLSSAFTNRELAEKLQIPVIHARKLRIAGCMTYSLCSMGILRKSGKKGQAHVFKIND